MLSALNISIAILWLISAAVDYSEFCYLWQLKEYRLDRLRDFFSTKQGQRYWLRYSLFWRSIAALLLAFWPTNQLLTFKFVLLLGFAVDLLYNALRYSRNEVRRPKITTKAIMIVAAAIALEAFLAVNDRDWGDIPFLIILRFPLLSAIVLALNKIGVLIKSWYIRQAAAKLARHPKLIVIGITGSYGKSSTKEFLSQILSERFLVIKTPKNTNTDIGVARFVLHNNFSDKEAFVCEMGAYRIGEIKKICDIVRPRIGILTAIIPQHVSLFGSLRNVQQSKYELLRSLPADGLAVTNADNSHCTEFLSELACQNVVTFGLEEDNHPDCLITEVESVASSVSWRQICRGGTPSSGSAPIIGAHQVVNIVAASMVARHLGITDGELQTAYKKLKVGEHGLKIYQYGGATVVDDSYNSNPAGFKGALDILTKFSSARRRIVITRGMLELGEYSQAEHESAAEEIAFCADELIVITPDFADAFKKGIERIQHKYRLALTPIYESKELLGKVREYKHTDAVILLENRIPKIVRSELMSGR